MNKIILKPGREKSLIRRHPWIFSGAVGKIVGKPESGETIQIFSAGGSFFAVGAWSPHSQISVRVWSFENLPIDRSFFISRIKDAIAARVAMFSGCETRLNACRLIAAESDGLPGVIADRYGDYIICQFLSAGAEAYRETIIDALQEICSPAGIYERSDVSVRQKEGLSERAGILCGDAPPEVIEIVENGIKYAVNVRSGHKTGFYLDQRDNRRAVAVNAANRTVLNCFSYTGGFGTAAAVHGATHVTNLDSSQDALAMSDKNMRLNGIDKKQYSNIEGDAFKVLRELRAQGQKFDLIILDPPKFIESQQQLFRGCRGYKDINILGLQLLNPGGLLFTFSCSGLMEPMLFQKIVADAALDAKREALIVGWLVQAPDHAVSMNFPEGFYLKGLQLQVR
ncbi:MAG: class I SAM-dependent methyltransferase [Victivallaceae bacterium]|nr:class I SAM-dependent methyltransferase [Victivallaceae bacterium]MDD4317324.1 class I SAM-dependent methyltransferase [Victivallaceae bacterium]